VFFLVDVLSSNILSEITFHNLIKVIAIILVIYAALIFGLATLHSKNPESGIPLLLLVFVVLIIGFPKESQPLKELIDRYINKKEKYPKSTYNQKEIDNSVNNSIHGIENSNIQNSTININQNEDKLKEKSIEKSVLYLDENYIDEVPTNLDMLDVELEKLENNKLDELKNRIFIISLYDVEFNKHSNPNKPLFNITPKPLNKNVTLRIGGILNQFFLGKYKSKTYTSFHVKKAEFIIEVESVNEYPNNITIIDSRLIKAKEIL